MWKVRLAPALLLLMTGAACAQPAAAPTDSPAPAPKDSPAAPPKDSSAAAPKDSPAATSKDSSGTTKKDSSAAASHPQGFSDQDKKFIDNVVQVNRAEIQVSRYAAQKAQSPAIKAFARLMVNDHGAVRKQLASLVNEKYAHAHARHTSAHGSAHTHARTAQAHAPRHGPISAEAPKPINHEAEEMMAKLKDKSGAEFDSAFIAEQVEFHNKCVDKFGDEIKSTGNEGVRHFAMETEDALKGHLQMAKAVKDSNGKP